MDKLSLLKRPKKINLIFRDLGFTRRQSAYFRMLIKKRGLEPVEGFLSTLQSEKGGRSA